ncbi:hypothetical protein C2845_PM04G25790 [Panicum miliaceum]|uniref:Uncharacterized protein n=1 Tax=Panicum miliaceum TaxID=4540 RepID=A0A3L6QMI5_PANMI|nr:hypothetical protein C2845_PM04G25790 [Panicum miliaceum]
MEMIGDNSDTVLRYTNLKDCRHNGHGLRKLEGIPLRPSCHRGLLMTIAPNVPAQ